MNKNNWTKINDWIYSDKSSSEDDLSDTSDPENDVLDGSGAVFGKDGNKDSDFWQKKVFVKKFSLFRNWSSKMRHMCEMCLKKETFPFDGTLVKQGNHVDGLHFIIKGQCRVVVDPSQHRTQYAKFIENRPKSATRESHINYKKFNLKTKDTCQSEHVKVRRRNGYAAAEKRLTMKTMTLCYVDDDDIIGDIELVFGLDTYMHTVTCTANTEVFILDKDDLERLIYKKNTATMDTLKHIVDDKVTSRASMRVGSQIELYGHLQDKIDDARPKRPPSGRMQNDMDENRPKSVMDTIQDRNIMMNQLSKMFIQNKAPFIEPSVPGSLYYLTKSSERAEKRAMMRVPQSRKRGAGLNTGEVRLQRARRRAQRQARSRRELEKLTLGSESQEMKKIKNDDHAVNRYLSHNVNASRAAAAPFPIPSGNEEATTSDLTTDSDQVQLGYKDIANGDLKQVVIDMSEKQQVSNANRAKIICSMIEKKASQQPSPIEQLTRPKSAPAPMGFLHEEEEEEEIESFDWETSDKALKGLEDKIRVFHSKYERSDRGNKLNSQVSTLKRFNIQGPEDVPIPGGTVYVRQKTCEYPAMSNSQTHQHVRRFMIPKNAYRMAVRSLTAVENGGTTVGDGRSQGKTRRNNHASRTQSAPAKRTITFSY